MTIKEYLAKRKEKQLQKKIDRNKQKLEKKLREEKALAETEEKIKAEEIQIEKPPEPTSLKEQLTAVNEKLDNLTQENKTKKDIKKKAFRLPFRVKSQLKKLALKNKVQIILLQNNGNLKPTIAEIKSGMVMVGDKIYDGNPKGIWLWNGKFPTMIIPEWDLRPINRENLYNDAVEKKSLADPQTLIIRGMEFKESLQPKGLGGKTLIWIGIGGIVVFYVLFAGG